MRLIRSGALVVALSVAVWADGRVHASGPEATRETPSAIASFQDVPALELPIADGIPKTGTLGDLASVFGRSDAHVLVIDIEDFKVIARHSSNQGTSFDPGVALAGGAGQPEAEFFRATQGTDGTVYVAMAIVDPQGGIGLQLAHTADMGQTWSAPVDIIRHGNPLHDIVPARPRLCVAAGPAGRAAVFFARDNSGEFYVVSSVDQGQTWTAPVRVDPGASAPPVSAYLQADLAIAPDGTIHVAYVQSRGSSRMMYTRSTDGGVSFEAERAINVAAGSPRSPDIEIANDGGVLIAYSISSSMVVLRSTNGGVSFVSSTLVDFDNSTMRVAVIRAAPGTAEVLVVCPAQVIGGSTPSYEGPLRVWRSTNNGASFGSGFDLAPQAYRGATFTTTSVAVQHTPSGAWAIAWMDTQADSYGYFDADVKAIVSLDGAATWGSPTKVQSGSPGASARTLGPEGMVVSSADGLVFAWMDGRNDNARSQSVYLNRAPAHALSFAADWPLAADTSSVDAEMIDPDIATDGASHVYTAFGGVGTGPYPAIYVAASADGGHTFAPPVLAGDSPAFAQIQKLPKVVARPDGHVFVLFQTEAAFGQRVLSVNRSTDYGATWSSAPLFLGGMAAPCPPTLFCGDPSLEDAQLVLGPAGRVYASWSDQVYVYVARSFDDGAHFTTAQVGGPWSWTYLSALCVHDDQVVLAYIHYDEALANYFTYAIVSPNGGVSWGPQNRISSSANGVDFFGSLACLASPNGEVLVAWSALAANERIFFNRWDGGAWGLPEELLAPPGQNVYGPSALITSPSNVLVTYASSDSRVYASRSTDGGHTFASYQRLDDAVPLPDAYSGVPLAGADGQGNVWVAWNDFSSGRQDAIAIRHSADDGMTWGPAYRLNRNQPQGGRHLFGYWLNAPLATLPGVGFAAYAANRTTRHDTILVNAYEPGDFDRDLAPAGSDCNDSDPAARAMPVEVSGLSMTQDGGTVISWDSQVSTAGIGTVGDVIGGLLSELHSDAGYARAACLVSGTTVGVFVDPRPGPDVDDGYYYLVRARNGCATGTFGDASGSPDARDALDAEVICPFPDSGRFTSPVVQTSH